VRIILLGPQRRPTVGAVVRSLGLDGPVATITAGWQEREPDDGELSLLLGGQDSNLKLYGRWLDVQDRDPGYAAGEQRLQSALAELQDLYLLRLDHALQAVYALANRLVNPTWGVPIVVYDILIAAAGRPGMINADWVKPGATIIDVGINPTAGSEGRSRVVGDVDFASVSAAAGAITPVPGGVGLLTVAMLMRNTLQTAKWRRGF